MADLPKFIRIKSYKRILLSAAYWDAVELETMDDLKDWMKSFPPKGERCVIELDEEKDELTIEIYNDYRE